MAVLYAIWDTPIQKLMWYKITFLIYLIMSLLGCLFTLWDCCMMSRWWCFRSRHFANGKGEHPKHQNCDSANVLETVRCKICCAAHACHIQPTKHVDHFPLGSVSPLVCPCTPWGPPQVVCISWVSGCLCHLTLLSFPCHSFNSLKHSEPDTGWTRVMFWKG